MSTVEEQLLIPNDLAALETLTGFVDGFCQRHGLSADLVFDLNLSLEEIVVNVITHGYDDAGVHQIAVSLGTHDGWVSATVEDDASEFNPLDVPPPDLDAKLEQRQIGGLGLHLVKNLMQELNWSREGDRNRLTMRKRIA